MKPREVMHLLDEPCVGHGFCLPPTAQQRLLEHPPADPTAFAGAVLREKGLDPQTSPRRLFREVRTVIAAAMRDGDPESDDAAH